MEKKIKAIKITTIITCIVMFACILVLTFQFIKIGNLKEKTNNLEAYRNELIQEINTYDTTNDYYNNNRTEYLEGYAREVLGWGLSGETWYTQG
ncbi:MAG: hypothetical protein ACI4PF_03145 [Christensenellales bacterium]